MKLKEDKFFRSQGFFATPILYITANYYVHNVVKSFQKERSYFSASVFSQNYFALESDRIRMLSLKDIH